MIEAKILNFVELPRELQAKSGVSQEYLVICNDEVFVDFIPTEEFKLHDLSLLQYWIQKAYALGSNTQQAPSRKLCALIAHQEGQKYHDDSHLYSQVDPLEEKLATRRAFQYDDIAERFSKGQFPTSVYRSNGKVVCYKVRGEHGNAYTVDIGATSCNCAAGRKAQECWHTKLVEIYIKAQSEL